MASSLTSLPNEVIQQILLDLDPLSLPAFQLVCHRFYQLVNPLIWRHLCETQFHYWKPSHRIKSRLAGDVARTDWKGLFVQRHLADRSTTEALNGIISSQMDRLEKFQQIVDNGYDAKDCLLRHYKIADDAEDVLARRYARTLRLSARSDLVQQILQ